MTGLQERIITFTAAIGAILTLLIYGRRTVSGVRSFFTLLREIVRISNEFPQIREVLTEIRHELNPKGGVSLRETINRTIDFRQAVFEDAQRSDGEAVGFFRTGPNGGIRWANADYLAILETTAEDVLESRWVGFIRQSQRSEFMRLWNDAFHEDRDFRGDVTFISARGREIRARIRTHVMMDGDRLLGALGTIRVNPDGVMP